MARDRRAPLQLLTRFEAQRAPEPPRDPAFRAARVLALVIWLVSILLAAAYASALTGSLAAALAAAPAARPVDCKVCSAGSLFLWGERQLLPRGRRGVSVRVCAGHEGQWTRLRAALRRKAVSA